MAISLVASTRRRQPAAALCAEPAAQNRRQPSDPGHAADDRPCRRLQRGQHVAALEILVVEGGRIEVSGVGARRVISADIEVGAVLNPQCLGGARPICSFLLCYCALRTFFVDFFFAVFFVAIFFVFLNGFLAVFFAAFLDFLAADFFATPTFLTIVFSFALVLAAFFAARLPPFVSSSEPEPAQSAAPSSDRKQGPGGQRHVGHDRFSAFGAGASAFSASLAASVAMAAMSLTVSAIFCSIDLSLPMLFAHGAPPGKLLFRANRAASRWFPQRN